MELNFFIPYLNYIYYVFKKKDLTLTLAGPPCITEKIPCL